MSSIHRWMSNPRYTRGARTWAPTANVTGRPERWISSASWMPVADAPTTSTPPSSNWCGLAILHRRHHSDVRRDRTCKRRHVGDVAGPCREHDRRSPPRPLIGVDDVAVRRRPHRRDRRSALNGRRDHPGVALDERDDLGHRHEPVRVIAVVGQSGQPALPVGRQQPQRVPTLRLPRVRDVAAFQHDVVDRPCGQVPAHRQTGVAGADDDRRCGVH